MISAIFLIWTIFGDMGNTIYILIACFWSLPVLVTSPPISQYDIPDVFRLSDSDEFADALHSEYSVSLLQACRYDANIAFQYWRPFTKQIEKLARAEGLNTPGTKLWIKAYWDKDGHLAHIGYAPKREDIQLNHYHWQSVFKQLIREHDFEGNWPSGFYHLGSICLK